MISVIKKILGLKEANKNSSDFSSFFRYASTYEKKRFFRSILREANNDQRDLVEKYQKLKQLT